MEAKTPPKIFAQKDFYHGKAVHVPSTRGHSWAFRRTWLANWGRHGPISDALIEILEPFPNGQQTVMFPDRKSSPLQSR